MSGPLAVEAVQEHKQTNKYTNRQTNIQKDRVPAFGLDEGCDGGNADVVLGEIGMKE